MKVAFITEMSFTGKVPRQHTNMRTEFAWMCALDADHYPFTARIDSYYDLAIIIIPKKNIEAWTAIDIIGNAKLISEKVAVMQEGPNWLFQDYPIVHQLWYYNTIRCADIIYTHNLADQKYYQGLTLHQDVRVLPSLMIEESIGILKEVERRGVIIGGNFVSWYGGFDSLMVAQEFQETVYAPSMGRKQVAEETFPVRHLPYLEWQRWIHTLNQFKYGVHLMRTHAAGTFALNCAYLGIPCIGYKGLDTQEICHPELTVELGDLYTARKLAQLLKSDEDFYELCSTTAKQKYTEHYTEQEFLKKFKL